MIKEKLQKILESHRSWLSRDGGERAYLRGAYLSFANLDGANLRGANISYADLSRASLINANLDGAYLRGAYLSGANIRGADICGADLSYADLRGANLQGADLRVANLQGAELSGANLNGANISYANLRGANLRGANLSGANICGANLYGADLRSANLDGVKHNRTTAFFAPQCPEEGAFAAWKKCKGNVLVKLLIPEDAKRSSATTRKCRASKAIVLEVIGAEKGISTKDDGFIYEVGKEVIPDSFDDDRWKECSHGIHFFITRKEAENY